MMSDWSSPSLTWGQHRRQLVKYFMQGSFCVCAQPMRDDISHWLSTYTKWSLFVEWKHINSWITIGGRYIYIGRFKQCMCAPSHAWEHLTKISSCFPLNAVAVSPYDTKLFASQQWQPNDKSNLELIKHPHIEPNRQAIEYLIWTF